MKRRNIMILMIVLSLVLLLGSSYALLRSSQVGSTPYVINVGTLQVTFEEGKTEKLSLENMYPMSDQEGSSRSEELSFIVKNTGNIEARYNVYLEETSTTEFKNHIKFISNKNDQGYNEPKTMGYDKYIDLEARLASEESASYKVKVWLDQEARNEYMDKTFTAKVVVESRQVDTNNTLYTKITNEITKHSGTTIVEDNVTYLSGSNDAVNYNYVWYSGKLWRIVSINSDGTIKMVTQDQITIIPRYSEVAYENSWLYQWLNEDFEDTLYNYQNIIVENSDWNFTADENSLPVKPETLPDQKVVKGDVGLLNAYEYYQGYKNLGTHINAYLNIGYQQYLLTPCLNENGWVTSSGGDLTNTTFSGRGGSGVRPSVNLKSNIEVNGNGSLGNPYRIKGDKEEGKVKEKINERLSGEYVNVDNKVYRIVGIENGTTKLISVDYIRDGTGAILTKSFGSNTNWVDSVESGNNNYLGYYLNNTWLTENLKQYITEGTYYLEKVEYNSYKNTLCSTINTTETTKTCQKTNNTWTGLVGVSRTGEMFSSQLGAGVGTSTSTWLITPFSNTNMLYVDKSGGVGTPNLSSVYSSRPTINLKSKIVISSGSGTEQEPYEIELLS